MISLATVVNKQLEATYLPILLESVVNGLPSVSEILLSKYDCDPGYYKEDTMNGVKVVTFCSDAIKLGSVCPTAICVSHALNLHAGIERASNDLVMVCDGDVFFYPGVTELYKKLMDEHGLNLVGVSHPAAITQSMGFMPNVLNMMFRRSEMPGNEFLKEYMHLHCIPFSPKEDAPIPGKYLVPGNIVGDPERYPTPTGHYETGCNLALWVKEKNLKWLSFQTPDVYNYSTQFYRSNFGFKGKIPRQKLIHHATGGSIQNHIAEAKFAEFKEFYDLCLHCNS